MVSKKLSMDWPLPKKQGWISFMNVAAVCGILLQAGIANAVPALGFQSSVFSVSKDVPVDLIVAVAIFVAMFVLRVGSSMRRQPVRQERPRDDHKMY